MRIVLDTAVLVRASEGANGLARQLLLDILSGGHTLLISSEILFEVAKVLRYPRFRHKLSEEGVYRFIDDLRSASGLVPLDPLFLAPIRDANDTSVIQTAVVGGAHVLCSNDRDFHEPVITSFLAGFDIKVKNDIELIRSLRSTLDDKGFSRTV